MGQNYLEEDEEGEDDEYTGSTMSAFKDLTLDNFKKVSLRMQLQYIYNDMYCLRIGFKESELGEYSLYKCIGGFYIELLHSETNVFEIKVVASTDELKPYPIENVISFFYYD